MYDDFDFKDLEEDIKGALSIPNYMQPFIDAQLIEVLYFNQAPFVGLNEKEEKGYAYSAN